MPAVLVIATRIRKDCANEIEKGAHEHRAVVIMKQHSYHKLVLNLRRVLY